MEIKFIAVTALILSMSAVCSFPAWRVWSDNGNRIPSFRETTDGEIFVISFIFGAGFLVAWVVWWVNL